MTLDDATHAFETYTRDNFRVTPAAIAREVDRLDAIAIILAKACRELEIPFNALDVALEGCDRSGLPVRAEPFSPSFVDEYALIESLFWARLSPPAETLLKVMLKHELETK